MKKRRKEDGNQHLVNTKYASLARWFTYITEGNPHTYLSVRHRNLSFNRRGNLFQENKYLPRSMVVHDFLSTLTRARTPKIILSTGNP